MSAGFYPDTSAAAFPLKSAFPFILQVKPGKFQNPFYLPIGSASIDFLQFSTAAYRITGANGLLVLLAGVGRGILLMLLWQITHGAAVIVVV
jgi:hypothetical protein